MTITTTEYFDRLFAGSLIYKAGSRELTTANGGWLNGGIQGAASPGANPFSVCCWVRLLLLDDGSHKGFQFFGKGSAIGTGHLREWVLGIAGTNYAPTAGQFGFGVSWDGLNNNPSQSAPLVAVPGSWYHLIGTWSGSATVRQRLYVNGVLYGEKNPQGTAPPYNVFSGGGNLEVGSAGDDYYANANADVCRVGYFGAELTAAQVAELYNGGIALNYSQLSADLQAIVGMFFDCGDAPGSVVDVTGKTPALTEIGAVVLGPRPP
jgi:hypothetical protein